MFTLGPLGHLFCVDALILQFDFHPLGAFESRVLKSMLSMNMSYRHSTWSPFGLNFTRKKCRAQTGWFWALFTCPGHKVIELPAHLIRVLSLGGSWFTSWGSDDMFSSWCIHYIQYRCIPLRTGKLFLSLDGRNIVSHMLFLYENKIWGSAKQARQSEKSSAGHFFRRTVLLHLGGSQGCLKFGSLSQMVDRILDDLGLTTVTRYC